ncbi:very short patch repair endonuclease [Ensifer sp. LC13]|nr:very short patch repair endonuclease [Ensifer sp. LC14]OCP10877.1 very short patch repair endonuclease [Ensifer sp. LC13]OCP11577.1 very short patch repair endonuclease [Ensifer sp. LC11]OCP33396.1 very short patch repair endonuclease [Ensifer sp. LC499]
MALIKSADTAPEMLVRRLVHSLGYRYRLHGKSLPGKPDLVFPGRKKVIMVHGCYWHVHLHYDPSCRRAKAPKTNLDYWGPKLQRNLDRDARNAMALHDAGWQTLVLWECELKEINKVAERVQEFLGLARGLRDLGKRS